MEHITGGSFYLHPLHLQVYDAFMQPNLAVFDPLIKAAQRLSGEVGVLYYEDLNMIIFFIDTDNGLTVVHKILLTDATNYTEDPLAYHIPKIKTGLKALKHMRDKKRDEYKKVTGGVGINKKSGHQF